MSKSEELTNAVEWYRKEYCKNCQIPPRMCREKVLCALANILLEIQTSAEEFFSKRAKLDEVLAKLKDVEEGKA